MRGLYSHGSLKYAVYLEDGLAISWWRKINAIVLCILHFVIESNKKPCKMLLCITEC